MEKKFENRWEETLASISMEIKALQDAMTSLEEKNQPHFFSRKRLAAELDCSKRFIQDSPMFKAIEKKVGGRVIYLRDEVDMIIRQSPSKRGDN